MHIYDFRSKKIALLGFGRSNSELFRYLSKYTDKIEVFDQDPSNRGLSEETKGIVFHYGRDCFKKLIGFDYIFRSPGIRPDDVNIQEEIERGAVLSSEIELFISQCKGWLIGITGSDGKTTTSSLIFDILKNDGRKVFLGGNIGIPLISRLEEIDPDAYVVLELSSFQLMTMNESFDIAVVTNISPNHLDYHLSYDEYKKSKQNIVKYAGKGSIIVLNSKDKESKKSFYSKLPITIYFNSKKGVYYENNNIIFGDTNTVDTTNMLIKGRHNIDNLMAAIAATKDIVNIEAVRKTAYTFKGVEHRIEYVDKINDVTYINDSIASSPLRTITGLKVFDKKVILIAGGKDKGIPYDTIGKEIKKHVKFLILLGQTKTEILKSVLEAAPDLNYMIVNTLEEAVKIAGSVAIKDDIVFFSPASTSFDMFVDFEDRGNKFKKCVKELKGAK